MIENGQKEQTKLLGLMFSLVMDGAWGWTDQPSIPMVSPAWYARAGLSLSASLSEAVASLSRHLYSLPGTISGLYLPTLYAADNSKQGLSFSSVSSSNRATVDAASANACGPYNSLEPHLLEEKQAGPINSVVDQAVQPEIVDSRIPMDTDHAAIDFILDHRGELDVQILRVITGADPVSTSIC
jgi:hypothetical protein